MGGKILAQGLKLGAKYATGFAVAALGAFVGNTVYNTAKPALERWIYKPIKEAIDKKA
jgi:hypothetical protein